MPYKSKSQMRAFFAKEEQGELPEGTARKWAHHTKNIKALPEHVNKEKKGMDTVRQLAHLTAELPYVEKLAADAQQPIETIYRLAGVAKMPVIDFVKTAYVNPRVFALVKKAGPMPPSIGGMASGMMGKVLQALRGLPGKANAAMEGGLVDRGLQNTLNAPSGMVSTPLRRLGTAGLAGGSLGGAGALMSRPGGNPSPAAPGGPESSATPPTPSAGAAATPGGSAGGSSDGSAGGSGGGGAGSGGLGKLLGAAGLGAGAGALGAGAVMKRKKKKEAFASDAEFYKDVMRTAIMTKVAEQQRKVATDLMCRHLDAVAACMPLEKAAAVRTIQREICGAVPLVDAIKVAYPHLNGAQHGIVASSMVRSALAWQQKQAGQKEMKTIHGEQTFSGMPNAGLQFMKSNC